MRPFLLYIVCNIIFLSCVAQDRQMFLVIDTVYNVTDSIVVRVNWPEMDFDDLQNEERSLFVRKEYPNVIGPIGRVTRNSTIELPLDKSGGFVALKNVYSCKSDTIHLKRLTVYTSCFPDSVYVSKAWYRKFPPGTGKELELLYLEETDKASTPQKCSSNYPLNERIIANGAEVITAITKTKDRSGYISSGHGYAYRTRKVLRRESRGKWVKYFHFEKRVTHFNLYAEIDMLR